MVIELDIKKRPQDEVYATMSYKLHRRWKSPALAETFCKNEGGQLASIHSKWEQRMVQEAAEGRKVWLGGRQMTGGDWHWADNSSWSFTNWKRFSPGSPGQEYLLMEEDGQWVDDHPDNGWQYFLCQGTSLATSTTAQLRAIKRNDNPFFARYPDLLEECLQNSKCDIFQDIYQNLGKMGLSFFFINFS